MPRRSGWRKRHRWRQAFAWACDTFPEIGKPRLIITPSSQMMKDEDGFPLEGLYDYNTSIVRIRAELNWSEGLAVLWHELAHAIDRTRCKLPDPGGHDVVHGLHEWRIAHAWQEGGNNDAHDYIADKR